MQKVQTTGIQSLEPLPEPLVLTEHQQSVYEALKRHAGEKWRFGDWYHGAIQAIRNQGPDYMAQAANSIREIAEKLPEFAGVPLPESPVSKAKAAVIAILKLRSDDYSEGWEDQPINHELARALGLLEDLQPIFDAPSRKKMLQAALEQRDRHSSLLAPELRRIRDQQFAKLGDFFQNVTHHRQVPLPEVFLNKVSAFENLILYYLTPVTASQQTEIAGIIRSPPTSESESRLGELLVHNSANQLFFLTNIQDPRWLSFLKEIGAFNQLREGEQTIEGSLVYRADPALSCLARLSSKAPKETLAILKNLPESTNPQIPDQIMRCVAGIEDVALIPECLKLLKKLLTHPGQHDWIWIEEILKTWTNLGCIPEAITLIGAYLNSHIRRQEDRYGAGTGWQFSEIDRDFVEPLIASRPTELGNMFFGALRLWKIRQMEITSTAPSAVDSLFDGPEENGDHGPSTYWLEDFKNRTSRIYELEENLATRLYGIGATIFSRGDDSRMKEFDEMLRSDSWDLFARLRWQLYADHPEKTVEWARSDFLPRIPTLGHYAGSHGFELAQMLEVHSMKLGSSFLSQAEIEQVYERVMAGPIDHECNRETDERFVRTFHRKQLHPIRSLLTGHALVTYQDLAKDKPELPSSSYKPFSSGGEARTIVYVAPKQAERLAEMGDGERWELLNTWKPEGNRLNSDEWWVEEHVSALGLKLADLLDAEPERFQASEGWWRNLTRPVVLYKPLERATARVSAESKDGAVPPSDNEWRNWFGLAEWIADWGGEPAGEEPVTVDTVRPEDRDWNWPRIVTVKFLASTTSPRFPIPEDLKPAIGRLLRKFLEDPDPRLAAKGKPILEDWLTTAINSVRGTALEDLLQLALHQKKESAANQPGEWIWQAVRDALSAADQSPAIYAIMGARLHLALYLYGEQFKQEPTLLMPDGGGIAGRQAFILAHVRYGNVLGDLLKILPDFPNAALDCLVELNAKAVEDHEQRGDFGGRLGSHLAYYYWNEEYPDLETGVKILDRYFQIAKPTQRSRAIRDIGRIFSKAEPVEDHESLFQLVRDLWDRRFSMIEELRAKGTYTADDVHEELSAFIDWLGCECHPFDWRHDRVIRALQLLERAPQAAFTIRTLKSLSQDPKTLGPSIEILESLIAKERGIVSWTYRDDEMKPILARGLGSPDQGVQDRARRVQEILLRHGLFEYLELESSSAESS